MVKVRAKTRCFIDNQLREEGDVFEYDAKKLHNASPLELAVKPAPKKQKRRGAAFKEKSPEWTTSGVAQDRDVAE